MASKSEIRRLADANGIILRDNHEIYEEAARNITLKYRYSLSEVKLHFDQLIEETEKEALKLYRQYEKAYVRRVLELMAKDWFEDAKPHTASEIAAILGDKFSALDQFFLSLAQGRKSRAGTTFEDIQNTLFKQLGYPFDEQVVINGKPDFVMPSADHYRKNAMDCIIFTSKRMLRERWRQIVTEGTRAYGFFLATIDETVSAKQISEMRQNKVYMVCPARIKEVCYSRETNVLSYKDFFVDYLDPAVERWKRRSVI